MRFLRSARAEAALQTDSASNGLDAFASEQSPTVAGAVPPERDRGSLWAIGLLAVAVLLQAYPTTLWLSAQFQPAAEAASVASPLAAITPPPLMAVAPCEASPPAAVAQSPSVKSGVTTPAAGASSAAASIAPGMLAGVVAVTAPVPMRVYERGRLIGTTEAESMMLGVGSHDLEFVNEDVGYRVRRTVTVQAGQTAAVRLEAPMGTLHVNAVPWAEVWIDNERVGDTPIGNLKTPIGTHQVVFRHPELGERRASVLVTLMAPARVSMDLRTK